jgi:hypothetical protein
VRFLIDECLSVDLVIVARQSGHEAQHVAHVGRAGWKDWNVALRRRRRFRLSPTMTAISGSSMERSRCMPALSF